MTASDRPVVLIVEDDPMIARLLRDIFSLQGFQTLLAGSAEAATEQLAGAQPALITLDLNLPGMSGQSLLRELRDRDETRDIPVIVVSAQVPMDRDVRTRADAVLEKPFELADLLATVNQVLATPATLAERAITA